MITFRKARLDELDSIMAIIDQARETMRASGNCNQWVDGYPARETIAHDVASGHCVVGVADGRLVASFAILPGPEPTYARIYDGQWLDDTAAYHVVHRLASDGSQRGVFAAVMNYCQTLTDNLRIDTHRDNVVMRHCLQRAGFTYCGRIYLANGDERLAYQKLWQHKNAAAGV